jgi:hypothetical protein
LSCQIAKTEYTGSSLNANSLSAIFN